MTKLYKLLSQLINDERGQDLVEYSLLVGFFAVAAGATVPGVADGVTVIFSKMTSIVGSAATV